MLLTKEEIQLIERAVENEIHNISKVIDRSLDHRKRDWIIKQRRLVVAMRLIKINNNEI
jgi:5-methylcytosine-specific restriction endonuclease McrBC GTP-binding regulatory subunit McrB